MSASQFFYNDSGNEKCYYCGHDCQREFKTKDYVKKTFTNRDEVICPNSNYVCKGCVLSLGTKILNIKMIDGEIRKKNTARFYSWVLTKKENLAATKSHIKQLREIILNPPAPPFAICLSDSGQKQFIFRTPISYQRDFYNLRFEDQIILVDVKLLNEYLIITDKLSAAIGKVALLDCENTRSFINVYETLEDVYLLENWINIKNRPLAKLAAWLTKNKEEAQSEYRDIITTKIQRKNSRNNDSSNGGKQSGDGGYSRGNDQIHFKFS
jgi:CRISPR type IV-associated protein Csf1